MTTFTLKGRDGAAYDVEADSAETAQKALDWQLGQMPAKPPAMSYSFPMRGKEGATYDVVAPSLKAASEAFSSQQNERPAGSTATVSPDASKTGDALSGAWDWLKGPGLTSAVRGTGNLIDAPNNLFEPARTMIEPDLANRYRQAMGPGFGQKLGDAFFRATGIPEYQAKTPIGRVAMAGIEGGIPGAVAGLPGVALGAAGSALGQGVREILPGWERAATAATMAPGALAASRRNATPEVPTGTQLREIGGEGYDLTRQSPVTIDRAPLKTNGRLAIAEVAPTFDLDQATAARRVIENKINMPGGDLSFNDVINLRDSLNRVIDDNKWVSKDRPGNPHERALAQNVLDRLDAHVQALPGNPQWVKNGTPGQVGDVVDTFSKARGDYAAGLRSDRITGEAGGEGVSGGIAQKTQDAIDTNPNLSYDKTLRQNILQFQRGKGNLSGFSPEERSALNEARVGGAVRNAARGVGNFVLGSGGGYARMGAPTGVGGVGGYLGYLTGLLDPATAIGVAVGPTTIGGAARGMQNRLGQRAINAVDELVRTRSPEYQTRLSGAYADLPTVRGRPFLPEMPQSFLPGLLAPEAQPGTVVGMPVGPDGKEISWSDYFKQLHGY